MSPLMRKSGDQRKCGPIGMLRSMISMRAPKHCELSADLLTLSCAAGPWEETVGGRLANKVAIITGGAGGIGAATGLLFCEEGARVALVDNDRGAMDAALAHIHASVADAQITGTVTDVANEQAAFDAVAAARKAFGPIDVLVNLAGIRAYEPLAEASAKTWERILAVN